MEQFLITLYENVANGLNKLEDFFVYMDKELKIMEIDLEDMSEQIKINKDKIENDIKSYKHLFDMTETNSEEIKNIRDEYNLLNSEYNKKLEEINDRFEIIETNYEKILTKKAEINNKDETINIKLVELSESVAIVRDTLEELGIEREEIDGTIDSLATNLVNQNMDIDHLQEQLKVDAKTTETVFSNIVDDWLETFLPLVLEFDTPIQLPDTPTLAYLKDGDTKSISYTTNKPANVLVTNQNGGETYKDLTYSNSKTITPLLIEGNNILDIYNVSEKGYQDKHTSINVFAFQKFFNDLIFNPSDIEVVNNIETLDYQSQSLGNYTFDNSLITILNSHDFFKNYSIEVYFNDILMNTIGKSDITINQYEHILPGKLVDQNEFKDFFSNITTESKAVNVKAILKIPEENINASESTVKRVMMPLLEMNYEFVYDFHNETEEEVRSTTDLKLYPSISVNSIKLLIIADDGSKQIVTRKYTNNSTNILLENMIYNPQSDFDWFGELSRYQEFYRNDTIEMIAEVYRGENLTGEMKEIPISYTIEKPSFLSEMDITDIDGNDYDDFYGTYDPRRQYAVDYYDEDFLVFKTNIRNIDISRSKIILPFSGKNLLQEADYCTYFTDPIEKSPIYGKIRRGTEIRLFLKPMNIDIRDLRLGSLYSDVDYNTDITNSNSVVEFKGDYFKWQDNTFKLDFLRTPMIRIDQDQIIETNIGINAYDDKETAKANNTLNETLDFKTVMNIELIDDEESKHFIAIYQNTTALGNLLYDNDSNRKSFGNQTLEDIKGTEAYSYSIPITQDIVDDATDRGFDNPIIIIETGYKVPNFSGRTIVTEHYIELPNVIATKPNPLPGTIFPSNDRNYWGTNLIGSQDGDTLYIAKDDPTGDGLMYEFGDFANSNLLSNNEITNVVLVDGVTNIGSYAFSLNSLTAVTIPDSVTDISTAAVSNNNLVSITIPNSVTNIGSSAFHNNNLTTVTIPDSVTSIGRDAFNKNSLTTVTIPNSVTSMGEFVFHDNNLTTVTIPNSLTYINNYIFHKNSLTTVTIPNSVTSIGKYVFSNNSLTSITIPDSVTTIESGAFRNNSLTSVTIPNSVTSIGNYVFYENYLNSVTIGSNVDVGTHFSAYGDFIFDYSNNGKQSGTYTWTGVYWRFEEGVINYTVTFKDYDGTILKTQTVEKGNNATAPSDPSRTGYNFIGWNSTFTNVTTNLTVTALYTVIQNNPYQSINWGSNFEDSVYEDYGTTLGIDLINGTETSVMNDFSSNENADNLNNAGIKKVSIDFNTLTIGQYAFSGANITSVDLPSTLILIDKYAFYDCDLTSVNIGRDMQGLEEFAFANNSISSLTISEFANNLNKIWPYCFSNNNLTSITLPDGINEIYTGVFEGNSITEITIGAGVKINDYETTMGDNRGFQDYYIANGKRAGTYTYSMGSWWI